MLYVRIIRFLKIQKIINVFFLRNVFHINHELNIRCLIKNLRILKFQHKIYTISIRGDSPNCQLKFVLKNIHAISK